MGDSRDIAKADYLKPNSGRQNFASAGTTPETGALFCDSVDLALSQPSKQGAMSSDGIQGKERDAYVTLLRATRTNVGSPAGRESYLFATEAP